MRANDPDWLAEEFETHRGHLRAVAYRMLGSVSEADDAVQEAWIRLSRTDTSDVENLRGWLTTVVGRVCLNILRSRKRRRETPFEPHIPDPVVSREAGTDPEHEALMGDSVGLALLVVLDNLSPGERIAFVLHDVFGLSFEEIATIVDRSPAAARQLASRGRRRVRAAPVPDSDIGPQRTVVNAFLAAVRQGDFDGLMAVLDPDVVARSDGGTARPGFNREIRGAEAVAAAATTYANFAGNATQVVVNGTAGLVGWSPKGEPLAVMAFTIRDGKIVSMDALADPERIRTLDLVPPVD